MRLSPQFHAVHPFTPTIRTIHLLHVSNPIAFPTFRLRPLFLLSQPGILSSLTFSSLLCTLHTPRADAAAKQQHVQALTTSLEKVVRLREKMSTAEVLLEALCARAYVAFVQAHACWCARVSCMQSQEQRSADRSQMFSVVLTYTNARRHILQSCNGKRQRHQRASVRANPSTLRHRATETRDSPQ